MIQSPRRRAAQLRDGFTLIEVMLASGLAVLVLAGVYASIDTYWRMRNIGEEQRHRVQVARAVYGKISGELRSIVFVPDEETDEITDPEALLEELPEETEIEITDPAEEFAKQGFGLIGDSQTLLFYVSRPMRTTEYSIDPVSGELSAGGADLRVIVYMMANGIVPADGTAPAAGPLRSAVDQNFEGITGLVRMEGDQATLNAADSVGDVGVLAAYAKMIADEVIDVRFEYADPDPETGLVDSQNGWLTSWNSSETNRLPSAIRMTLTLRRRDDQRPATEIMASEQNVLDVAKRTTWVQQLTIPMPLYHPDVTPDELETEEP